MNHCPPLPKETTADPLYRTVLGILGQHLPLCYLTHNQFFLFAFCQVSLAPRMFLFSFPPPSQYLLSCLLPLAPPASLDQTVISPRSTHQLPALSPSLCVRGWHKQGASP